MERGASDAPHRTAHRKILNGINGIANDFQSVLQFLESGDMAFAYTWHPIFVAEFFGLTQAFFVIRGEGGGVKSWRRQALFQGRHCFCPTPTLRGGGGPVKEAGTHAPPCPQYLPNIKPHAMHQIFYSLAATPRN